MMTFEERLAANLEWALMEGSIFFENRGAVQTALRRIAKRLDELGVPYAVAGGMALYAYGYRRFTEDVDIVLTPESLQRAHEALEGRGYLRKHKFSKNLRDTELGVGIDFLVTGQFPGDGKPKPVAFPTPVDVAVEMDGVNYVSLETLVCLKLACGISSPDRAKDLSDVQELIKSLQLPAAFADKLDPFVQQEYERIWRIVNAPTKRYVTLWRNQGLKADSASGEPQGESDKLRAMLADGVTLDPGSNLADDHALLVTTDPAIAKKYDMTPEDEFWPPDESSADRLDDE